MLQAHERQEQTEDFFDPSCLRTKSQVPVDDFVAARAPSFSKIQQTSTTSRKRFNSNYFKTAKFNNFQYIVESGSGPGGRRFKSSRPDHSFQRVISDSWFFVYSGVDDFVDGMAANLGVSGFSLRRYQDMDTRSHYPSTSLKQSNNKQLLDAYLSSYPALAAQPVRRTVAQRAQAGSSTQLSRRCLREIGIDISRGEK